MEKKPAIAVFAIVIVVVLALVVLAKFRPKTQKPAETTKQEQSDAQEIKTVLSSFPPGFPAEANIQNVQSHKYTPVGSVMGQSSIQYTSKKSFKDNVKIFQDYLTSNGFAVDIKTEKNDTAFYFAKKGADNLIVNISSKGNGATIDITYLKK